MGSSGYVDIGVIIVVLLLGIRGLKNGLIHEIMGVIGVVLGIYLASRYCVEISHYLRLAGLEFGNETILFTLSFIIILSIVWIGSLFIGYIVSSCVVIIPGIAIINYFGGYVFASLKYFVILCVVVYALSQVGFLKAPIKDFTKGTKSYPIMYEVAEKIMSMDALEELQSKYNEKSKEIEKSIEKKKEEIKKNLIKP